MDKEDKFGAVFHNLMNEISICPNCNTKLSRYKTDFSRNVGLQELHFNDVRICEICGYDFRSKEYDGYLVNVYKKHAEEIAKIYDWDFETAYKMLVYFMKRIFEKERKKWKKREDEEGDKEERNNNNNEFEQFLKFFLKWMMPSSIDDDDQFNFLAARLINMWQQVQREEKEEWVKRDETMKKQKMVHQCDCGEKFQSLDSFFKHCDTHQHSPSSYKKLENYYWTQGIKFRKLGKYQKAIECFKRVLTINPKNYKAKDYMDLLYSILSKSGK